MKKILSLIIGVCLILSLFSCSGYDPVESSAEESRIVMTLNIDGESYAVKYELYRAFFLTLKSTVDGGKNSVWTGEDKELYIEIINGLIKEQISNIYATIHAARKIGKDVLSSKYDDEVEEYIKVSVDGGEYNGDYFEGYGEDYNKYLASLREKNLNYSVQDLLIRYAIAALELGSYYAPSINGGEGDDAIEYNEQILRDFYNSEECVRVLSVFLDSRIFTKDGAVTARESIASASGENAVAIKMINLSTSGAQEIKNGMVIGKHSLDDAYFSELTYEAFSLGIGELSQPIYVNAGSASGYYIIYRADKSEDNFKAIYDSLSEVYVTNEIGKIVDEIRDTLVESAVFTEIYNSIVHSEISMN